MAEGRQEGSSLAIAGRGLRLKDSSFLLEDSSETFSVRNTGFPVHGLIEYFFHHLFYLLLAVASTTLLGCDSFGKSLRARPEEEHVLSCNECGPESKEGLGSAIAGFFKSWKYTAEEGENAASSKDGPISDSSSSSAGLSQSGRYPTAGSSKPPLSSSVVSADSRSSSDKDSEQALLKEPISMDTLISNRSELRALLYRQRSPTASTSTSGSLQPELFDSESVRKSRDGSQDASDDDGTHGRFCDSRPC